MQADPNDTIVALSSAPGSGGRAVVRLSGPDTYRIVLPLFQSAQPVQPNCRRRYPGGLSLPDLHSPLAADLLVWPAPRTYTGQDLVELHLISSPPLVELLIAELLKLGARAALPGEFTLRAFLAGKLDLPRAEAVLGVLEAGNRDDLKLALSQLAGGLTRPLDGLRDDLLNLLADLEAGLDFADEDITFVNRNDILLRLGKGLAQLTLAQRQIGTRALSDRPFRVVLAGPPNAGKSSLFNALTGGQALVSPMPGTTRDYLMGRIAINDVTIELIDTAGWQAASDGIEEQAQHLADEQSRDADMILWCAAANAPPSEKADSPTEIIRIATKCDRADPPDDCVATSAVTGQGIESLRALLADRARARSSQLAPSLSRCRHHVEAALEHLRRAHQLVLFEEPTELIALELRGALDQLGEMVGAGYTNDLLDRVFSRFCIGK